MLVAVNLPVPLGQLSLEATPPSRILWTVNETLTMTCSGLVDIRQTNDQVSCSHSHLGHCNSNDNHSVLQLLKRNLRLIFFAPICAEVQVLVSV